jgi:hypothetical protein
LRRISSIREYDDEAEVLAALAPPPASLPAPPNDDEFFKDDNPSVEDASIHAEVYLRINASAIELLTA